MRRPNRRPNYTETEDIQNWEIPPDYIIYKDDADTIAVNGDTGKEDSRNTNSATVIQYAIDALTSGGEIFIKKGSYSATSKIIIKNDDIVLCGSGKESTIITYTGVQDHTLTTQSGLISFDDAINNIEIRDMKIDADAKLRYAIGTFGPNYAGAATGNSQIHLDNLHLKDGADDVLSISTKAHDVLVENCLIERTKGKAAASEYSGIEIEEAAYDIIIMNNIIDCPFGTLAADIFRAISFHTHAGSAFTANNVWIDHNMIKTVSRGINFDTEITNIWITNNTFSSEYTAGYAGTQTQSVYTESATVKRIHISGNTILSGVIIVTSVDNFHIDNNYIAPLDGMAEAEIRYRHVTNSSITDNVLAGAEGHGVRVGGSNNIVAGNIIANAERFGIWITAAAATPAENIHIYGNIIYNSGQRATGADSGIFFYDAHTYDYISVHNNLVYDDQGAPTMNRCIDSSAGATIQNCQIFDNILYGCINATVINPAGFAASTKVERNIGYVTENNGTATILSGNANIAIAHGLNGTPTTFNIAGQHSEVSDIYVTTVGAANFTIVAKDGNTSANRAIYWEAKVR